MKSIETLATLAEDGTLTAKIPPLIAPGEHQVVIVIDESRSRAMLQEQLQQAPPKIDGLVTADGVEAKAEQQSSAREPLRFSAYPVGLVAEDFTFRREDLYDDGDI